MRLTARSEEPAAESGQMLVEALFELLLEEDGDEREAGKDGQPDDRRPGDGVGGGGELLQRGAPLDRHKRRRRHAYRDTHAEQTG